MEKVIFGDNQFFAVNHLSDEKSRAQAIKFKTDDSIIRVLDTTVELGINTFMCTTHDRIANICEYIRNNKKKYKNYKIYPSMPYAHKYANAVTELGYVGTLKQYIPGNIFNTFAKGGIAFAKKDFLSFMEILIDSEMKMFKGIDTPIIFIQNVLTDLILGLGMYDVFIAFKKHVEQKYNAEAGFITMNMPRLFDVFEKIGIQNPIICSSINKIGFRMSGGKELYEQYIKTKEFRPIAMQVLAAGALRPSEAFEYINKMDKIQSVLFGASTKEHIMQSRDLILQKSNN